VTFDLGTVVIVGACLAAAGVAFYVAGMRRP
jgi:hypothetical protein